MNWGHNSVVEHLPARAVEGIWENARRLYAKTPIPEVLGNDPLALFFLLLSVLAFLFHLLFLFTGGNGYINDFPMGRFLRDAKLYEIGAGTSEVRRLVIGRAFNADFR